MAIFNFGHKRWRYGKVILGMVIFELPLTVAILTLFGIADPDTYRTRLWQDGFNNGFNSSPAQPVYDMVNGKTKSLVVPLVWSATITQFNLVASVITVFVLLVKTIMVVMNKFWPSFSLFVHSALLAIYAFSLHGQGAPDMIDRNHQNPGLPWYIAKSCSVASIKDNVGYCVQAKASYYVTAVFVAFYSIFLVLTVHSMLFAPPKKPESDEESYYESKDERQWEMVPIPETPGSLYGRSFPLSPTTPRTRAFNALEGDANAPKPMFPPPPKAKRKK